MSYKYRTVKVRGTDLVGTIARKHGSPPEIYETSKDPSTSVVPVLFPETGEIRFFDRSVLEDVVSPGGLTNFWNRTKPGKREMKNHGRPNFQVKRVPIARQS